MTKNLQSKKNTIFNRVYVIGIFAAFIVIITLYFFPDDPEDYLPYIRFGFLIFSISHVLILAAIGFRSKKTDKVFAGSKVQTAGYLHTLLAFVLIFAQVKETLSIDAIFHPMGAALITSILGWFLGGELISFKTVSTKSLQNESKKLADELGGFCQTIEKIHEDYVKNLTEINQELSTLHNEQTEIYKKASKFAKILDDTSYKISKNLGGEFDNSISNLSQKLITLRKEVETSTKATKDVAKYLYQSRVLIEQLEGLIDYIINEKHKTDES